MDEDQINIIYLNISRYLYISNRIHIQYHELPKTSQGHQLSVPHLNEKVENKCKTGLIDDQPCCFMYKQKH